MPERDRRPEVKCKRCGKGIDPVSGECGCTASACSLRAFVLPDGVAYEDLRKVTVSSGSATHIASPWSKGVTLCGRKYWFDCVIGTDHYCALCQQKLAKIKAANA